MVRQTLGTVLPDIDWIPEYAALSAVEVDEGKNGRVLHVTLPGMAPLAVHTIDTGRYFFENIPNQFVAQIIRGRYPSIAGLHRFDGRVDTPIGPFEGYHCGVGFKVYRRQSGEFQAHLWTDTMGTRLTVDHPLHVQITFDHEHVNGAVEQFLAHHAEQWRIHHEHTVHLEALDRLIQGLPGGMPWHHRI